ncbi:MAG: GntR family transcriptional regulator [Acidobacteria bacterium]|nr:GntR family transcriptional regulator [Acidobacteriota bacterium]
MDLNIDPRQSVPIYAQVVEQVRSLVLSGGLKPGDRMPSVRDLAASERINRNTVAKAYSALESDGILETRRGEGTFVASLPDRRQQEAHAQLVERFVERVLAEGAGLGLTADELANRIAKARRAPQRAASPAGDAS